MSKQAEGIVLVSTSVKLPNIKSVTSVKGLDFSKISCFIFHSSEDEDSETAMILSDALKGVDKVLYFYNEVSPVFFAIFTALKADIYNDVSYLTEEGLLDYLISNYRNTQMTVTPVSTEVETLLRLIGKVDSSSPKEMQELFSNRLLVQTVANALSNVGSAVERTTRLNERLVEMFSETRLLISSLIESHQNSKIELDKLLKSIDQLEKSQKEEVDELRRELTENAKLQRSLEDTIKKYENEINLLKEEAKSLTSKLREKDTKIAEQEAKIRISSGTTPSSNASAISSDEYEALQKKLQALQLEVENERKVRAGLEAQISQGSALVFPSVSPPLGVSQVLYVKVHSPTRYLNSFILGFQQYLKSQKRKSSKVIFLYHKVPNLLEKYTSPNTKASKALALITPSYIPLVGEAFKSNNAFITFDPIKTSLDFFFSIPNTQLFIVVDHLGGKDSFVTGARVKQLSATGSKSDIELLSLNLGDVISCRSTEIDSLVQIPHIKNYPDDVNMRASTYGSKMKDEFEKLNNWLYGG